MASRDGSPRNLWALVSPGAGLVNTLLLFFVGFRDKNGFPAPAEIYVIGAGFILSILALVLAVITGPGNRLPRISGAAIGLLCLPGWFLRLLGGYM
jgi:hypothetical protein